MSFNHPTHFLDRATSIEAKSGQSSLSSPWRNPKTNHFEVELNGETLRFSSEGDAEEFHNLTEKGLK